MYEGKSSSFGSSGTYDGRSSSLGSSGTYAGRSSSLGSSGTYDGKASSFDSSGTYAGNPASVVGLYVGISSVVVAIIEVRQIWFKYFYNKESFLSC